SRKVPRARVTHLVRGAHKFTQVGANHSARTHGPRRLAATRHAEVRITASPPEPRRPAHGVSRSAPHRPRWTSHFRPLLKAYPPLWAQRAVARRRPAPRPPSMGPSDVR